MSRLQKLSKFKDSPPNMAGGVRFEIGGAYFNFRWQNGYFHSFVNLKKNVAKNDTALENECMDVSS